MQSRQLHRARTAPSASMQRCWDAPCPPPPPPACCRPAVNRRMDEWVPLDNFNLDTVCPPEPAEPGEGGRTRGQKRKVDDDHRWGRAWLAAGWGRGWQAGWGLVLLAAQQGASGEQAGLARSNQPGAWDSVVPAQHQPACLPTPALPCHAARRRGRVTRTLTLSSCASTRSLQRCCVCVLRVQGGAGGAARGVGACRAGGMAEVAGAAGLPLPACRAER